MTAVFLDRDGVINYNRTDYVRSWRDFQFLPGAAQAIARLTSIQASIFVVTNQPVVNKGIVSLQTVEDINRRMVNALRLRGGSIREVMTCPHVDENGCDCRKPRPGLLLKAQKEYGVDLKRSYLVGDFVTDIDAARAVGSTPILVLTGRGAKALRLMPSGGGGVLVASDLADAAHLICELEEKARSAPRPGLQRHSA